MALKLLDIDKFLSSQQAKTVTNPRQFDNNMEPAVGGLQDPNIFGVSTKDRFNTWGLINLDDVIMHPFVYDNLNIIDPIFKRVQLKKSKVNLVDGKLQESEKGGTGLSWIVSNWANINLDKYRTDKNKLFIDFLQNTKKNLIFINKVPVLPIVYREAHMGSFKMELDEVDEIYQSIIGMSKSGRSEFTSEWMQTMKDTTGKDMIQSKVNALYAHFIKKLEGKSGFLRNSLAAKRLNNVSRMVANARPDIPVNSAVIPWHILLNLFDIFVVAWLKNDTNGELAKKLGIIPEEKSMDEYGELFDHIYRNSETYVKHYPGNKEAWIEILTNIFNENPMLRVILKRDPGWNADSLWCFQPLINTEESYQIWVPAWVYSPLGGDSLNTNFFIASKDNNIVFDDDNYVITCSNDKARIVKTMNSIYKRI